MAKATYPAVWLSGDGTYLCEMRDKKTGRVWGIGQGDNRVEAIMNARQDLPADSKIKRVIGWITRHPFIAGFAAGAYLSWRHAYRHGTRATMTDHVVTGLIVGTAAIVTSKVVKFIRHLIGM